MKDLEFKTWLEAVMQMNPVQAMRILGLSPGQILTPEMLQSTYRKLARKYHPDIAQDSGNMMTQLNVAKDSISRYVGKVLPSVSKPSQPQSQPQSQYRPQPKPQSKPTEPDDGYWSALMRSLPPETLRKMWPNSGI